MKIKPDIRKLFFENVGMNDLETLKENFNEASKQQNNN